MASGFERFTTRFSKNPTNESPFDGQEYCISQSEIIDRGGREGRKIFIEVINPHHYSENLWFVAKEYELSAINHLSQIVTVNQTAKKCGLPVPNTIRYFEYGRKLYLLLSDQTSHGKFHVWGYNSCVQNEPKLFADVVVTNQSVGSIFKLAHQVTTLSTQKGALIKPWNYHIRLNVETNKHDIILLDLIPDMFTHSYTQYETLKNENNQSLKEFSERVIRLASLD